MMDHLFLNIVFDDILAVVKIDFVHQSYICLRIAQINQVKISINKGQSVIDIFSCNFIMIPCAQSNYCYPCSDSK